MQRTAKSSKPSFTTTRRIRTVKPSIQEETMLRNAVRRAEAFALAEKERKDELRIRLEVSNALKSRVLKEKQQKLKYQENEKQRQINTQKETERRKEEQRKRLAHQRSISKRFSQLRNPSYVNPVKPDVKALTDHFRLRVKEIETRKKQDSSSDQEFYDALPPDSPKTKKSSDNFLHKIKRVFGRGKKSKKNQKTNQKKNKKTHRETNKTTKKTRKKTRKKTHKTKN